MYLCTHMHIEIPIYTKQIDLENSYAKTVKENENNRKTLYANEIRINELNKGKMVLYTETGELKIALVKAKER